MFLIENWIYLVLKREVKNKNAQYFFLHFQKTNKKGKTETFSLRQILTKFIYLF